MNKHSTIFLTLLVAANLQLQMLSQATIIQSKSFHNDEKQNIKTNDKERALSTDLDCLPGDFKLTDIISYRQKRKESDGYVTIKDKLIQIKAQCKKGKLLDSQGREIRFFKFSCFGNPPSDYEEIIEKEREEFDKLQKRYTVLVLECDPQLQ